MPAQVILIPPIESCVRKLRLELGRRSPVTRAFDPLPIALLITYAVYGDEIPVAHRLKVAKAVCRLLNEPEDEPPPEVA